MTLNGLKIFPEFNEDFTKNYNDESDKGYFLEVDVQYPENSQNFHNYLPFLLERMKMEKIEKLVANLLDKTEYVTLTRNLKQASDHGLVLKKVLKINLMI